MVRGGSLIKAARNLRGLTQDEVAFAYGVSAKSVQRWETFQTEPKFCDVFSIITDICKMSFAEVEEAAIENH